MTEPRTDPTTATAADSQPAGRTDDERPPTAEDDFQAALRQSGYRLTLQRQLVLQAVADLEHATPDAVAAEVHRRASGVNLSTVYRTLDLLEELGLVTHTHLGHGSPTYHVAADADHLHLVCQGCGSVQHVDEALAAPLSAELLAGHGFCVDLRHFAIYGRCAPCAAEAATTADVEAQP